MLDYVSNILWFPRLVSESLNYGRAGSEFCENGRDLSGDRQESPMIDAILRFSVQLLLALYPRSMIRSFHSDFRCATSCGRMMMVRNGSRGGIFRCIPCSKGLLCHVEEDPNVVVTVCQLTVQVEEPATAEYCFLLIYAPP
ncbi:hypothetical protein KIN20_024179 [Parelaphostrongylus tenuis]|uniref:Uncharacterized protein n=1 Tax=Parelaphostrongylus tenuis TaxID=148309 RepID=A0AAD5MT55_PARTN|nr:hypothetical protein KIN20_024179 [Parelaphostrongylus tenuis]